MKNKDFFYLQYNKVNWQNQQKTKINFHVNNYIIKNILFKKEGDKIGVFDVGFGVGFFLNMLTSDLPKFFQKIILEGCEPSSKNYLHFKLPVKLSRSIKIRTFNSTFLNTQTQTKFDFLTAIYVFPHFESNQLSNVARKIYSMLGNDGKFILVVANEKYLLEKLREKQDLFIEKNTLQFYGKKYKEVLHYSEIPQIGTIIDYNREERFYLDLFTNNGLLLNSKENLDDNGFICTVYVFSKK
jgi:hypothetical protein